MTDHSTQSSMWECLLGVRHKKCPISDTSVANPSITIQNVSRADIPGTHGRRLLFLRGDPDEIDNFEQECRNHEGVVSLDQVSDSGDEAYFAAELKYQASNPSVLSILNSMGIFHHGSIMVQEGVEHWLVYCEEKSTIRNLEAELESHDNDVFLYRMVDLSDIGHISDMQHGMLLSQLTTRQRTAFRTALELGYYDGESDMTVSDIADELDLHETTTWEHLNKAENAILTDVGSSLFSTIERKEA